MSEETGGGGGGGGKETGHPLKRSEQVMPWTDQSVNPAVKTDPGAGYL